MNLLIDEFLRPQIAPEREYFPESDVVEWREINCGQIFLEIFKRRNGTFGYRYVAWVAWRDAGNAVRTHSWHVINAKDTLITDSLTDARHLAEDNAKRLGLFCSSGWKNAI